MKIREFIQRLVLVMLVVATSLSSFARFDFLSENTHSLKVQKTSYAQSGHELSHEMVAEGFEEEVEEEFTESDFEAVVRCICKFAAYHALEDTQSDYESHITRDNSSGYIKLCVFRL